MERVMMRLPPGFRFHPTDEELVEQYLRKKVFRCPLPAAIIPDVELSRFDPWDLPAAGAGFYNKEKYFFNWREAKYRVGSRCNRASGTGYWKITGRDRQVVASRSNQVVGMKRVLVFYQGKAPRGARTDWVMHEYRLAGAAGPPAGIPPQKGESQAHHREEDWVLCRVFKKGSSAREAEEENKDGPVFFDFLRRRELPVSSESSCVTSDEGDDDDGGSSLCLRR